MRTIRSEFADAEAESAFARYRIVHDGRSLSVAAFVLAVAWVVLLPADWAYTDPGAERVIASVMRLSVGAVVLAVGWALWRRMPGLASVAGQRLLTGATAWSAFAFLVIVFVRGQELGLLDISAVLFGTAVMLFVPVPLLHRATVVSAFYLLFAALVATRAEQAIAHPGRLLVNLAAATIGAAICGAHLERTSRHAFDLLDQTVVTNQRLAEEIAAGEALRSALARQASEDDLTGLLNRRSFFERASKAVDDGGCGSAVLVDVDRFKEINDSYGHAAGDRILQRLARTMQMVVRDGDLVGRIGGEEFAVFLPRTSADVAMQVAERIRSSVARRDEMNDATRPVTVSVGVTEQLPGETVAECLARADAAMYRSKRAGGDRLSYGLHAQ